MDVNAEAGPPHVQAVDEPPGGATGSQVQTLPGNNGEDDDPRLDTEAAAEPIAGIADGDRNPSDQTFGESSGLRTYTDLGFSSGNENLIPTPGCRICYQGAELGELLSPCRCAGTVRYAHQHCLLKWICERGSTTCEICNCKFNMVPIRMKPPHQWQSITMTVVEKVQVIAVLLGTMFLLASLSWLLWSLLSPDATWQRNDILFQICYGMYAVMDIVCVGLVAHEGRAVCKVFRRWRAVNLQWNVQTYNKCRDLNCPPHNQTLSSGQRVSQEQVQTSELDSSPQCPLFSTCLNATPETPVSPPEPSPDERVMRDTSV